MISIIVTHSYLDLYFLIRCDVMSIRNFMSLSVSSNEPGIKPETWGVIWYVSPESKIQLVNFQTITKISTITFFNNRHMCHRCIYILIVIIITVLGLFLICTITPFIKREITLLFVIIFRWFWEFINKMIYRSTSKTFARWAFSVCLPKSPAARYFPSYFLIFSKYFSVGWLVPPQKVHFVWTRFALYLFLPDRELLSIFK